MKSFGFAILTALAAQEVAAHSTFQELWVNGVDKISVPVFFLAGTSTNCMFTEPHVSALLRQTPRSPM